MRKSLSQRLEDRYIDACSEFGDDSWQAKSVKKQLDEELEREERVLNTKIKTGEIAVNLRNKPTDRILKDEKVYRLEEDGSLTPLEPVKEKKKDAPKIRQMPKQSKGAKPKA